MGFIQQTLSRPNTFKAVRRAHRPHLPEVRITLHVLLQSEKDIHQHKPESRRDRGRLARSTRSESLACSKTAKKYNKQAGKRGARLWLLQFSGYFFYHRRTKFYRRGRIRFCRREGSRAIIPAFSSLCTYFCFSCVSFVII